MSDTKIGPKGKSAPVTIDAETNEIVPDETAIAVVNGGGQVSLRKTVRNELILAKGANGLPLQPSYLDCCYAVSPWNPGTFHDGSMVLDRDTQIYKPGDTPLTIVLLSYSRYYAEWRQGIGGGGELRKYDTIKQAIDAGEVVPSDDRGGPMPTVGPAYDFYMLVRKPEGVESDKFVFKLGDHWYCYCKFSVVKSLGRDADKILGNLCAYEAGIRGVKPGEGQCNRFLLDLGLTRVKKDGKTYTNLLLKFHAKDKQPEAVPSEVIRDTLSLLQMSEDAPAAETDDSDCPL